MLKAFILTFIFLTHPVHVTLMSVEYSEESDAFNVFLKINSDDFIFDYRNSINDDQDFDPSGIIDTTTILVNKYFDNKVQIFADDKKLEGRLMKIESADGEIKMNFLFNNHRGARRYKVKSQILTELYKDQSNLLIFKYKDFEEGIKLTSGKLEQTFKIK